MADTIEKGITISFRGDTVDFDKGVSKINGELKGLKSELSLLNRELKLDPSNFDKLSQKMDVLKERESLLKEELNAYNEAMASMDKNSDEFKKAETKARNLQIEIGYVTKSIEEMGGNKLTLALNNIGGKFDAFGEKVTGLGKKFAGISTAAAGVLGAFGKLSYDVVKSADDINTLSKQTGLSTETLQVFGQMADLIDVDLNTLSKTAVKLSKDIDTKSAQEAYQKLGVSIYDLNGNYRSSEELLFDTLNALQSVEDETERSLIANDLYGKSFSELGSIINGTSVDLEDINKQVRENGTILSQEELDKLNAVNDNIDKFKMTISGMGTSLVSEFQEPLANLTEKLADIANKVKEWLDSLSTEDKEKILTIIAVIATIAPLLTIIGTVISKVGALISTVGSIIQFIIPIVQGLFTLLMANPIALVVAGIAALIAVIVVIIKNFDTIKEKISEVWEKFKQTEFVQTLISWFDKLVESVKAVVDWFKSLFDWVGSVIDKVGEFFSSGISTVIGWFSSGGFGDATMASGGYGSGGMSVNINVNNNGRDITSADVRGWVSVINEELGKEL